MSNLLWNEKNKWLLLIIGAFVLTIGARFYNVTLISNHFLSLHLVFEFFSVFVSFSIVIYGWKAYSLSQSRTLLFIPMVFLAVGCLDLFNAVSYQGLSIMNLQHSTTLSLWFWFVARLTEAMAFIFILVIPDKNISNKHRRCYLGIVITYIGVTWFTIVLLRHHLPPLVVHHNESTSLKNNIDYFICLLQGVAVVIAYYKYAHSKNQYYFTLVIACSFLLMSEMNFAIYKSNYNLNILLSHLYKTVGYLLIFYSFYLSKIQLTFVRKKKTEKDLSETLNLIHSIYHNTPDSIILLDKDGIVINVNPGFEDVFGWKAHEVVGKNYLHMMPSNEEDIKWVFDTVSKGERIASYETIRIRKDGSSIHVNMTITPIQDPNNKVQFLAAIMKDISKQRIVEQQIRKTERELTETIQRQHGIIFKFKKINDSYIHTLCGGELLYAIGLYPEQIIGKELANFSDEKTTNFLSGFYNKAWMGNDVTFEARWTHGIYAISLKPMIQKGETLEVIGSVVDITQLKQTEQLLQKSEKIAVIGELAAGIAHEIRNPLTTVKGFHQLIKADIGQRVLPYFDLIAEEIDRIEKITSDFIAVAKPKTVSYGKVAISSVLEQVIAFMEPQALVINVGIYYQNQIEDDMILGNQNEMKQVFINIIKNALEAMSSGGMLYLTVSHKKGYIVIQLKDTGCGISPEMITRLGEPFYTLKEKGTGLGLMVSFRIIESHGGEICYESKENYGTTVEIMLPQYNESQP